MNIADILFWPTFLMFLFALIFLGASWFYQDSIHHLRSELCRKISRWCVFLTGAVCGSSAFLAGFIKLSVPDLDGGLAMLLGFLIIQIALLLAPSRKLPNEKRGVGRVKK